MFRAVGAAFPGMNRMRGNRFRRGFKRVHKPALGRGALHHGGVSGVRCVRAYAQMTKMFNIDDIALRAWRTYSSLVDFKGIRQWFNASVFWRLTYDLFSIDLC